MGEGGMNSGKLFESQSESQVFLLKPAWLDLCNLTWDEDRRSSKGG